MLELKVGESTVFTVVACIVWNHSDLHLRSGERYDFEVRGNQVWWDASNECGADGYSLWYLHLFAFLRRYQAATWFVLIGSINKENPFVIGKLLRGFAPEANGELICFANDAKGFYGNNRGKLRVTVTRVA